MATNHILGLIFQMTEGTKRLNNTAQRSQLQHHTIQPRHTKAFGTETYILLVQSFGLAYSQHSLLTQAHELPVTMQLCT